jgi:hypothetical protein
MTTWISIKDDLLPDRTLVFIFGIYHGYYGDSPHKSMGVYYKESDCWQDILDPFPTSGDTEVQFWTPIEWPASPE